MLVNGLRTEKHIQGVIQLLFRGDVISGTPPNPKGVGLDNCDLSNILVRVCRNEDLSANLSRAPVYCGLCIDFLVPHIIL